MPLVSLKVVRMSSTVTTTATTVTTANMTVVSCETLEAECNVLGMELLNVLEYIGDTIDYRKITLLVRIAYSI